MLNLMSGGRQPVRRLATMRSAGRAVGRGAGLALTGALAGCASASLDQAGALSSYAGLTRSDGILTQSQISVDKPAILAAQTVRIVPTSFTPKAQGAPVSNEQRRLIANAIDRSLCVGLGERFTVVADKQADLTVQAFVSDIVPTNEYAAAASKAASVAKSVLLPDIPGPTLRLPIGLGKPVRRGRGAQQGRRAARSDGLGPRRERIVRDDPRLRGRRRL